MNHIITGDERNVKNLETQVYVSWGMSFKDGQISSQKANLQYTLLSADNGGYTKHIQSERRIVSYIFTDVNHNHFFLFLLRRNVKRV